MQSPCCKSKMSATYKLLTHKSAVRLLRDRVDNRGVMSLTSGEARCGVARGVSCRRGGDVTADVTKWPAAGISNPNPLFYSVGGREVNGRDTED